MFYRQSYVLSRVLRRVVTEMWRRFGEHILFFSLENVLAYTVENRRLSPNVDGLNTTKIAICCLLRSGAGWTEFTKTERWDTHRTTAIDHLCSAVPKTVNDQVRNYYCNCLEWNTSPSESIGKQHLIAIHRRYLLPGHFDATLCHVHGLQPPNLRSILLLICCGRLLSGFCISRKPFSRSQCT